MSSIVLTTHNQTASNFNYRQPNKPSGEDPHGNQGMVQGWD